MRILLAMTACCALASISHAQSLPPRVAQALSYLPPHSETLAVDQNSLAVPLAKVDDARNNRAATLGASVVPANLQLSVVAPALAGRTIELSLEARSNFRPPKGLGLMHYDGCGLLYLKSQVGQTRESLKAAVWKGMKRTTLAGQEVGVFEMQREQNLWRIYVAVPRPDLIVTATDRASMITTLARMQRPTLSDRAIPASWSGWKLVDTRAPFWAVRRLDLPQSTGFPIVDKRDPKMKALVVYQSVQSNGKSEWIIKCDGNSKELRALFVGIKSEVKGTITSRKGAQITEFVVSEADGYFTFYALGLLGTGIYL